MSALHLAITPVLLFALSGCTAYHLKHPSFLKASVSEGDSSTADNGSPSLNDELNLLTIPAEGTELPSITLTLDPTAKTKRFAYQINGDCLTFAQFTQLGDNEPLILNLEPYPVGDLKICIVGFDSAKNEWVTNRPKAFVLKKLSFKRSLQSSAKVRDAACNRIVPATIAITILDNAGTLTWTIDHDKIEGCPPGKVVTQGRLLGLKPMTNGLSGYWIEGPLHAGSFSFDWIDDGKTQFKGKLQYGSDASTAMDWTTSIPDMTAAGGSDEGTNK